MDINNLKSMFDLGGLAKANVVVAPMSDDLWFLEFETTEGKLIRSTGSKTKTDKIYKRIFGAIIDAQKVGFCDISLKFRDNSVIRR